MRHHLLQATVVAMSMCSIAIAAPQDQDVFEDFEGISPNTAVGDPITLGTTPNAATLAGDAFAGVVGQGVLYHSGVRSWMVVENGTGTIDFETNAATVEFFIRTHPTADGDTVVTAFDDSDTAIGPPITIVKGTTDPSDPLGKGFFLVQLTGNIDRIEIQNLATNVMNGIDDLGYSVIPEPATLGLLLLGACGLAPRRRRHNH